MKKMTEREKDIYSLIKARPTITRKDIAKKLDISESAVGTHLHNLSNKGYLLGRGYITAPEEEIIVIGGSNIDIKGHSEKYFEKTSNPGIIKESLGGVGRNIAENLGHLGRKLILLTAVGDDHFAQKIIKETSAAGVNMDYIKRVDNEKTGLYLAHLDSRGDLIGAISDMNVLKYINRDYLYKRRKIIDRASILVFDSNISKEAIEYLLNRKKDKKGITVVETVSLDKSKKLIEHLDLIDYITPNISEAEALLKLEIAENISLSQRLSNIKKEYRQNSSLPVMIISCGSKGVYLLTDKKEEFIEADLLDESEIVETTGAGDALAAGIVDGLARGEDLEKSIKYAIKIASLTIKSSFTVNPDILELLTREK